MKGTFYITTPIYYPNDIPHIGHAYTTVACDVLARWHRLNGEEVFFLTGTDEHGRKIEQAAEKNKKKTMDFVNELIPKFKDAWQKLNIGYSRFIRTTEPEHYAVVREMLKRSFDNGDIYLGKYEGNYCTGCEAYYTEKELDEGCCRIHKTKAELISEETYFFRLSAYREKLLELYDRVPDFIMPHTRMNEIKNRLKEDVHDLSISRTSFSWGIPLPFDAKHVTYVWFDALANYLTGVDYPGENYKKFWPAVHLVGKDILWFHSVIWPAMLMSAGIETPRKVFAHGWWTFDKEKISKSRGKVINIDELIAIAGVDAARYFLMRETTFGQDGDFSSEALLKRRDSDLANELGNLVSRTLTMCEKYCGGMVPVTGTLDDEDKAVISKAKEVCSKVKSEMEAFNLSAALNTIWELVKLLNQYVDKTAPWVLAKEGKTDKINSVFSVLTEAIRITGVLVYPFIPATSEKIIEQLGIDGKGMFALGFDELSAWGWLKPGTAIKKGAVLFPKDKINAN